MGNRSACASGGSGAGYGGIIKIPNLITARVIVGEGGYGVSRDINSTPPAAASGQASSLTYNGTTIVSAGPGTGANTWQSDGTAGTGGTLTFNGTEVVRYFMSNGNNGKKEKGSSDISVSGAASVYEGHTYGKSGGAFGCAGGGTGYASKHGYVYIRYIGNNPIVFESDAPGEQDFYITKPGTYHIDLVGGGGGGCGVSNGSEWWTNSSGGSGAYVYGNIHLEEGRYYINVGAAGKGGGGYNGGGYTAGGATSFNGNVAGGGDHGHTGGYAEYYSGQIYGGPGGTASAGSGYTKVNGKAGTYTLSANVMVAGGASVFGNYGKGGDGFDDGEPGYARVYWVNNN